MINLQAHAPQKKIRVIREIDRTKFMLEPEIQILKDMDEIDQKQTQAANEGKLAGLEDTAGDILYKFLYFYGHEFKKA